MHGVGGNYLGPMRERISSQQRLLRGSRRCPIAHGAIAFDPPDLINPRVFRRHAPRQSRRGEDRLLTDLGAISGEGCAAVEGCRFAVRDAMSEVMRPGPRPER